MQRRTSLLAVIVLVCFAPTAHAQGTARSMDLDISIRSAAMGGASNALFWGEEQNHWANPALLGDVRGVRYEYGKTQLVPGLADNVFFKTGVLKIGGEGLGLAFSGKPFGLGQVHLDYGTSQGVDENGNPTGIFDAFEDVSSWGFGVSLARFAENLTGLTGGRDMPRISRYADVSLGMNFKTVDVALAPTSALGRGNTRARDVGVLARVTPLDFTDRYSPLPVRLDLAYGGSILNYNDDARIRFPGEDFPVPVSRHHRHGGAVHLAIDAPSSSLPDEDTVIGHVFAGFKPALSFGYTFDRDDIGTLDHVDYRTTGHGYELTIARVFSMRRGHYTDRVGEIDGTTSGWSVGVPIGPWAGFLYEEATFPQAQNSGLKDLTRKSAIAWIDPLAISRSLRR